MKNPIIRFVVATLAGLIALFVMVAIFTLLKLQGTLFLLINAIVAISVWKFVYSLGADNDKKEDSEE